MTRRAAREGGFLRRTVRDGVIDPTVPTSPAAGGVFRRTVRIEREPAASGDPYRRNWSRGDAADLYSTKRQGVVELERGRAGVRFFQPEADYVRLVIDGHATAIPMRPDGSGIWEVELPGAPHQIAGRQYAFEVVRGHETRRVADPFADAVGRTDRGLVSRFADLRYEWTDGAFRRPPIEDLVIYETHLPALSRHRSSGVAEADRGTFRGARAPRVLDHLSKLGVAVEFLPLHASDGLLGGDWGYWTTSFRAITERYAREGDELAAGRELKATIDALHRRGIPVILDVVYNHGGELHVRALGTDIMHRVLPDGRVCDGSGCGPTVRSEHPMVRAMIVQTLRHLVEEFHVDGFRMDLGALHDKRTMLEIDRHVPGFLIAEPWAMNHTKWLKGDLHTLFRDTRWAVWNDDFREPGKALVTGKAGDGGNLERLKIAIKGSHVADGGWTVRPQQSINYLTSHDGATLADVVGGDVKRQFLGMLLVLTSQGVPMISEGTEMMFSKGGEGNSWNQPERNRLDWRLADEHRALVDGTAALIALRKALPHFAYSGQLREGRDIRWIHPSDPSPHVADNAVGFVLEPPAGHGGAPILTLLNGSHDGAHFALPGGRWKVVADGLTVEVDRRGVGGGRTAEGHYYVHPGTGILLERQ